MMWKGIGRLGAAIVVAALCAPASTAQVVDGNVNDIDECRVVDTSPDSQGQSGIQDDPLSNRCSPAGEGNNPSGLNVAAIRMEFNQAGQGTYFFGIELPAGRIPFDVDFNNNHTVVDGTVSGQPDCDISDTAAESYSVFVDIGDNGSDDLVFQLNSVNGVLPTSVTVLVAGGHPQADFEFSIGPLVAGQPTGNPEFAVRNIRTTTNPGGGAIPAGDFFRVRVFVTSGSVRDGSEEDTSEAFCMFREPQHDIVVEKTVACARDVNGDGVINQVDANQLADGAFSELVTSLPEAAVFWRIKVTNPGIPGVDADCINVTVNDPVLGGNIKNRFPAAIEPLSPGETVTATIIAAHVVDTLNTVTVTGQNALTGAVANDSDDARVDIVTPCIECTVLIDDDANCAPGGGDPTPPVQSFNLAGKTLPISLTACITIRNCGQVPLELIMVTSPVLQSLGFVPPAPFALAPGATNTFSHTFDIESAEDCAEIDASDGATDGQIRIRVNTTGQVMVVGGQPCVLGDENGSGTIGANERVDAFTQSSFCDAAVLCPRDRRVPTLSEWGLILLAAGFTLVMLRRSGSPAPLG